jgi:hypothetical protein
MEEQNTAKLRRELALMMANSRISEALRQLKNMPLAELESLSNAESRGIVDDSNLDKAGKKELEMGLGKLNFYVCGILMHRVLDGE